MIGDVLLIEQKHERVARELAAKIHRLNKQRLAIAIGGESGSGKSEIAETLRAVLRNEDSRVKILHLDNYYKIAPAVRTDYRREHGMDAVGLHEIDWDMLEENIEAFRQGKPTTIPFLDLYTDQEDKLVTDFGNIDILIIEGLYACNATVDIRAHIDLTYHETKKAQLKRKKEKVDKLRFMVLEKEHQEVTKLRGKTDYFVTPNFTLVDNTDKHTPLENDDSGRMLFCSGNLPFSVRKQKNGFSITEQPSGVGSAIGSVYGAYESLWFGNLEIPDTYKTQDRANLRKQLGTELNCHPIFLGDRKFMTGHRQFCDRTLWPLCHYRPESCQFKEDSWHDYQRYNKAYYDALKPHIHSKDTVWIHDHQLLLLPALIRKDFPEVAIGFFLHTPFPSFELFRLLPWRIEILQGMIGADLIGFHIYEYTRHFQSTLFRILGHETKLGSFITDQRLIHTDAFSLGVDFNSLAALRKTQECQNSIDRLSEIIGKRRAILSVDRLDPSRGINEKLDAIESLFQSHKDYARRAVFLLRTFGTPHDTDAAAYRKHIAARIKTINRKYGTASQAVILHEHGQSAREQMAALYNVSDILLVGSLRDGMNLIGKEYVAARNSDRGTIVLSEFAGGARELSEAIPVNPYDLHGTANAIAEAITMPVKKQISRFRRMKQRQRRNTALHWAVDFIEGLKSVKARQLAISSHAFNHKTMVQVMTDYHQATQRLILLDYNGTLVPIPKDGRTKPPPSKLLDILALLGRNKHNRVVLITDNSQSMIDRWFKDTPVDLIACSDAAYRMDGEWTAYQELSTDWRDDARPILEKYVVRTPGSYIDEKKYAMIWHFENAVKELGEVRSRELMEDLRSFTGMENLKINEGQRLIEIKNAETYKASMLKAYVGESQWEFMLAVGDDESNESMFQVLPPDAYTIRIGSSLTSARYNLADQARFLGYLRQLTGTNG